MDIVFLGINDVMRTDSSDLFWSERLRHPIPTSVYNRRFDPKAVSNLNFLYNICRYKIVVTSEWRKNFNLQQLKSIFRQNSVEADIVDTTETLLPDRGKEIIDWLDSFPTIKKLIVIDGSDNVKDICKYINPTNIIRCDKSMGFGDYRLLGKAVNILS